MRRVGATVVQATPATWRLLLATGWVPDPTLRVWCGGEALPTDLAARLVAGNREVWNLYGPTETTIWSTIHPIGDAADAKSIGRPIGNTQIYIVDDALQPVPPGVVGELLIGGRGVSRGYWRQPAQTAGSFIPDPFGDLPGQRLYRTGDQARYLSDGRIEFLGRVDAQIKLRGFRIELGEIEQVLGSHPDVRHAAVSLSGDDPQHAHLVAHLVLGDQVSLDDITPALLEQARQRMPGYMVPARYQRLDALPLTPNRKIDRRRLAELAEAAPRARRLTAPETALEQVLVSLWSRLLKADPVGLDDNFFDLGGHSLVAAQALSWLRRAFRVEISLRQLFDAVTIASLRDLLLSLEPSPGAMERTAGKLLALRALSPEERAQLARRSATTTTTTA